MHAESGSTGNLSYEFQVPRAPNSASARSSISSGIGSSNSFFSPPGGRYPFAEGNRFSFCDVPAPQPLPPPPTSSSFNHLSGILTGSAECLEGAGCLDGPSSHFLRPADDLAALTHPHHHPQTLQHHHHHHQQQPPPPPPHITNSHLHNLLTGGDAMMHPSSSVSGGGLNDNNQEERELLLSLEIANRVKAGDVSTAMSQWAAATVAARTVENGVN